MSEAEELLEAGAVLAPGTEGAGENAVPLSARTYRHPALEGRTVVRLVDADLGEGADVAAGFLGLETAAEPEIVGVGRRASLGFPEWVLVHHPQDGHRALALVPELERAARRAKNKPKTALAAFQEMAARLASSVPHLLPSFYERAAREFLAVENPTYAAQMFTRARTAEVEHGLAIDEEHLDAVFLEFALAGALQVKTLSGYAADLSQRVSADEALRRFSRLCVRRTAGGVSPSARMATDLRRLAKAAGADAKSVEHDYLAAMLDLPAISRAAGSWWKAHRQALVSLAVESPEIRGKLLNLIPQDPDYRSEMPVLWVEILEESGAAAGLCDPDGVPEEARPQDGSVGWLKRFHAFSAKKRRGVSLPALYPLIERMADRLRNELAASGEGLPPFVQPDLLDLLLALGVPVAAPPRGHSLNLDAWSENDDRQDLTALAADHRFRESFHRGLRMLPLGARALQTFQKLLASPGGRPVLTAWVRETARETVVPGLPDLHGRLEKLIRLPDAVLALAEEEMREVATTDLAPLLVRALRAGLFDELGWPAWEEAMEQLGARPPYQGVYVTDAWPYLIVANSRQARVIGAEGTVLVHDLHIPAGDTFGDPGFHYVDCELLVHWRSRQHKGEPRGYWHKAPDRQRTMTGELSRSIRVAWFQNANSSLQLPGGGRTTGAGVLHRGDTVLPGDRHVISDGTSYWVWQAVGGGEDAWHEYDPVRGEIGRRSMPAFFADATRGLPEGSTFAGGTLLTPVLDAAGPDGASVGGMDGWRVVRLPDGSYRGEDLAGNTVTAPAGFHPKGVVFLPGDDRPRALVRNRFQFDLVDPDGVVTASARTDRLGRRATVFLPPPQYWHGMRPRDPRGSQALRRVDRETAAALVKAVPGAWNDAAHIREKTSEAVRSLLPEVTHEGLIVEIGEVARTVSELQTQLDEITRRLDEALAPAREAENVEGPSDGDIRRAARSVFRNRGGSTTERFLFASIELFRRAQSGRYAVEPHETHLEGIELPPTGLRFDDLLSGRAAMAHVAVSELTPAEDREVLGALLGAFGELGMTGEAETRARWRVVRLHLSRTALRRDENGTGHWRALLPLEGGAFLAVVEHRSMEERDEFFTAFFYDPSGRFEVPSAYQVLGSEPLTEPEDAFSPEGLLAEAAARGPAPWFPEAAEEFARRTGVTPATAKLIVAGLPGIDLWQRSFLPATVRTTLKVKIDEAALAKDELRRLQPGFRKTLVGTLVPADPARLWTEGPDAAAAAEVWNAEFGRRTPVPGALLAEAVKETQLRWSVTEALTALFDPAVAPALARDLKWEVKGNSVSPVEGSGPGFNAHVLVGAVAATAWLAHRLPAGDPLRARLPAALAAVRDRLTNPDLLLNLGRYVDLVKFRKMAGSPGEEGEGYERYGAVVVPTTGHRPYAAVKVALLDEHGQDPYLPVLREGGEPVGVELALRLVRDERFAALLADPGGPAAGERSAEGTWWPQDPSRSVPEVVAEAVARFGLGTDAAVVYLMLLAMPDPTDRNTARWTGWKPARLRAARAELAATDLVVEARRVRAARSLFLPGGWSALRSPVPPQEEWKLPLYDLARGTDSRTPLGVLVPAEPVADLYRRAWRRVTEGDAPRFTDLEIRRGRRR